MQKNIVQIRVHRRRSILSTFVHIEERVALDKVEYYNAVLSDKYISIA